MTTVSRRLFLAIGFAAPAAGLSACGGGSNGAGSTVTASSVTPAPAAAPAATTPSTAPAPVPSPAPALAWDLSRALYFVANGASSFDLSTTLPAGVTKGGTFGVDGSGTALPAGLTLSANGLLLVTVNAPAGDISGIVFAYNEP